MITKRILVGNAEDAKNPPPQVGAVLMVAEEQYVAVPARTLYAKIPFKEFGKPTVEALREAVAWVETHVNDHRLMVCCRAGMGRSVSVVIAYLCCVEGLSYDESVKLVLTRRPGGMPLPQLKEMIDEVRRHRPPAKEPSAS